MKRMVARRHDRKPGPWGCCLLFLRPNSSQAADHHDSHGRSCDDDDHGGSPDGGDRSTAFAYDSYSTGHHGATGTRSGASAGLHSAD